MSSGRSAWSDSIRRLHSHHERLVAKTFSRHPHRGIRVRRQGNQTGRRSDLTRDFPNVRRRRSRSRRELQSCAWRRGKNTQTFGGKVTAQGRNPVIRRKLSGDFRRKKAGT
jgi:hypothetical protein